ncbi:ABC-type sugar transport system ATPase subunit [Frondihabitans sp. PhB188]|nr:ABC-type sugar transport system ATPase subunit [Frondihabitans sp. PhB188]
MLVSVRDLEVARDGRPVLRGASFTIGDGEVVALLGPNGAGKSTLLSALTGLVTPSGGTFEIDGRIATALQTPGMARRSALANVELALGWWGVPRSERRPRARAALTQLAADHLADRRASLLSGGEQRRVHLARALAVDADVLLLDEPFAGLDGASRAALLNDTSSALRSRRGGTLVVAHDRAEAWALADRILVLLDGRIAADGPAQAVLDAPPTAEVARFLGYDGEILRDGQTVLTRAVHVRVTPGGSGERAIVTAVVPIEDGFRVALDVDGGRVHAVVGPAPRPAVGDSLSVVIETPVRFDTPGLPRK